MKVFHRSGKPVHSKPLSLLLLFPLSSSFKGCVEQDFGVLLCVWGAQRLTGPRAPCQPSQHPLHAKG